MMGRWSTRKSRYSSRLRSQTVGLQYAFGGGRRTRPAAGVGGTTLSLPSLEAPGGPRSAVNIASQLAGALGGLGGRGAGRTAKLVGAHLLLDHVQLVALYWRLHAPTTAAEEVSNVLTPCLSYSRLSHRLPSNVARCPAPPQRIGQVRDVRGCQCSRVWSDRELGEAEAGGRLAGHTTPRGSAGCRRSLGHPLVVHDGDIRLRPASGALHSPVRPLTPPTAARSLIGRPPARLSSSPAHCRLGGAQVTQGLPAFSLSQPDKQQQQPCWATIRRWSWTRATCSTRTRAWT